MGQTHSLFAGLTTRVILGVGRPGRRRSEVHIHIPDLVVPPARRRPNRTVNVLDILEERGAVDTLSLTTFTSHPLNYGDEAGLEELATAGLSPDHVSG